MHLDTLFNESLARMKKNGAILFEMYYDETSTTVINVRNGGVGPTKDEITRGISLRAFDGEKQFCLNTEDLSDSNLHNMVDCLAKKVTRGNRTKQLRYNMPKNIKELSNDNPYDWSALTNDVVEAVSVNHDSCQGQITPDNQVLTRCFFQNQRTKLLSSYNGIVYDNRSRCCVKTDVGNEQVQKTNILTPNSLEDLSQGLKKEALMSEPSMRNNTTRKCPSGTFDIVLSSGSASLFFHECCGHPLEIHYAMHRDSIFKKQFGKKIANDCVSFGDNGSLKGLWGSIKTDDEGNLAREKMLIQNGILVGFLTDLVQGYKYNLEVSATTRRQSYKHIPSARMTNTFIARGNCSEENIIKNTNNGLLIQSFNFGNVNPITGDFKVYISSGNFIKNGVVCENFYGGYIHTNALEVLSHIDMVADNLSFCNGFCYAPSGRIAVSGGQPTLRISSVPVYCNP